MWTFPKGLLMALLQRVSQRSWCDPEAFYLLSSTWAWQPMDWHLMPRPFDFCTSSFLRRMMRPSWNICDCRLYIYSILQHVLSCVCVCMCQPLYQRASVLPFYLTCDFYMPSSNLLIQKLTSRGARHVHWSPAQRRGPLHMLMR